MADLESPVEYTITLEESRNTLKTSKENLQPLEATDVSDVALSEGQAEELIAALKCWNEEAQSWTGPVLRVNFCRNLWLGIIDSIICHLIGSLSFVKMEFCPEGS